MLQTALTQETPGISRIDARGCYREINDCYARLLGYTPEELLGKHWSTVFVSQDLNEAGLAYEYLAANGKAEFEAKAVRKDGSIVHLHVVNRNLTGPAGQPLGYRCLIRDLSDRKKTEAALHTADLRFRLFAEMTRDVFWIASPSRRVDYVSPAFAEIWGTPCEMLYKDPLTWKKPIHPDDQASADWALERQARGEATQSEYRIVRPDASVRWIRDRAFPAVDYTGERIFFGIAEDITEKKTEEHDQALRRKAQRDAVVREVQHRFKNHLQAVVGLLGSHLSEGSEANAVIQAATAQLLTLAAIHGLQATGDKKVTLETAVPAIVRALAPSTEGIAVEFSSEIEQGRRTLIAEEERAPLALIIGELIFNAGKHGSDRPIRVTMTREGEGLGLSVVNSGWLPAGFEWAASKGLGTGLSLVASLLPPQGISLSILQEEDRVIARLLIGKPVISRES